MKDEALGRQLSPRMPTAMTTEMTIWCCGLTPGGRSGTHVIWLTIHQQDSASFSRETQQRHALSYLLAQTVGTRISSGDGWNEATTTCMAQLPLQSTRLNWSRMTCNIGLTSFSMRLTTPGLLRNLHQSTHTHTHTHTHTLRLQDDVAATGRQSVSHDATARHSDVTQLPATLRMSSIRK